MIDFKYILPNSIRTKDDWWEFLNEFWDTTETQLGIKDLIFLVVPENTLYTGLPQKWDKNKDRLERIQKYTRLNSPTLARNAIHIPALYDGYQMGTGKDGEQKWLETGNPNFGDWLESLKQSKSNTMPLLIQSVCQEDNIKNLTSHLEAIKESNLVPENERVTLKYLPQIGTEPNQQTIRVYIKSGIVRRQEVQRMVGYELLLPDDIVSALKEDDVIGVEYVAFIPKEGLKNNASALKILKLLDNYQGIANQSDPAITLKTEVTVVKPEEQKSAGQQIKEARLVIAEEEAKELIEKEKEAEKQVIENLREGQNWLKSYRPKYFNPEYIQEREKALEFFRLNALKNNLEEDLEYLRQGLLYYYDTGRVWMKSDATWYKAISQFVLDTQREWKKVSYEQKRKIAISAFKTSSKKYNATAALLAIEAGRIMYSYAEDKVFYWPLKGE